MDDIVERLTEKLASARPQYMVSVQPTDLADVLGEVVRLRAEVERLVKSRNKWGKRYNDTLAKLKAAVWTDTEQVKALNEATIELAAECDRLRDALRNIDSHIYNDNGDVTFAPLQIKAIIDAALKGDTQ